MNKQGQNKLHKAQGALTSASKKRNNKWTNTVKTVSEALHKTSKINIKNEHLNVDNVRKSTIFTGSEFQAFMTRSLKSLLWFVRQSVFYIICTCCDS